jgi:acyl dehydratase
MAELYYEDLTVGQRFRLPARTITEADVVNFAGVSGDYNRIHTDREYAKTTMYGQRIVHGMLGLSVLTGLLNRSGLFDGSVVAMLGINDWRFENPIFIDDTISCEFEIVALRLTKTAGQGIVDREFYLTNQRSELVQRGKLPTLVRLRAAGVTAESA